jgi:hypothetical protein
MTKAKKEDVSVGSGAVAIPSFPLGMKRKDVDGKTPTPSDVISKRQTWKMFEVTNETFVKFKPGSSVFEQWSTYLNLENESEKSIYEYAKTNKNYTIVLKNRKNGSLKSISREKNQ